MITKNIKIKKTKINILTAIAIVLAFAFIFIIPSSYAIFDKKVTDNVEDLKEIFNGTSGVITATVIGSGDEDSTGYHAIYQAIADPDNGDNTIGGQDGLTINQIVTWTSVGIAALSIIACIVTLATRAAEQIDKGQDQDRAFINAFIWVVISSLIIVNISPIITMVMRLGTALVALIAGNGSEAQQQGVDDAVLRVLKIIYSDDGITTSSTTGYVAYITAKSQILVPSILNKLIIIATKFAILSAIIEIGIRRIFAPVAVADIVSEGARSPGIRYLKKFLATYLKIGVMVIISELAGVVLSAVMTANNTNPLYLLIDVVAVNLTSIGMIFKCGEYVNEALGV